jgi:hypothetical protein
MRLTREIRTGVVTVNCFGEGDVSTSFGGYKQSGSGGLDKSTLLTTNTPKSKLSGLRSKLAPFFRTDPDGSHARPHPATVTAAARRGSPVCR